MQEETMKSASPTFARLSRAKRERILDAATEEFAEHGFHQASVSRMVRGLGIAKGSIFQYFGSKEGLFEHLFGHFVEQLKAPLKAVRAQENDFFERIRGSLLAGLEFIEAHPKVYRIYLKVLYQENAPFRERILSLVRGYSSRYLRPLIIEAQADGQLRPDLDPALVFFLVDGLLDRFLQARSVSFLHQDLFRLDRDAARDWAAGLADMLRRGMAPDAAETTPHGDMHA